MSIYALVNLLAACAVLFLIRGGLTIWMYTESQARPETFGFLSEPQQTAFLSFAVVSFSLGMLTTVVVIVCRKKAAAAKSKMTDKVLLAENISQDTTAGPSNVRQLVTDRFGTEMLVTFLAGTAFLSLVVYIIYALYVWVQGILMGQHTREFWPTWPTEWKAFLQTQVLSRCSASPSIF